MKVIFSVSSQSIPKRLSRNFATIFTQPHDLSAGSHDQINVYFSNFALSIQQ